MIVMERAICSLHYRPCYSTTAAPTSTASTSTSSSRDEIDKDVKNSTLLDQNCVEMNPSEF